MTDAQTQAARAPAAKLDFFSSPPCDCPGCLEFRKWMAEGMLVALHSCEMKPARLTHNIVLMLASHIGEAVKPGMMDGLLDGVGRLLRMHAEEAEREAAAREGAEAVRQ